MLDERLNAKLEATQLKVQLEVVQLKAIQLKVAHIIDRLNDSRESLLGIAIAFSSFAFESFKLKVLLQYESTCNQHSVNLRCESDV